MINIIVAMDEKRGIGKNNQLLFKIPEDMKRFKALTTGHPVIMGRKTYESIGRPLPNRTNIIVTRDNNYKVDGAVIVHSLEEALRQAQGDDEIFVIGGGQIYAQALPFADKLYLTIVEGDFGADTFFPDYSEFKKIIFEKKESYGNYSYRFIDFTR